MLSGSIQKAGNMIGKTVSHYKIVQKLGEGGMGVVYKAMDTTLGRPVALKFVTGGLAADESTKQRLMREAKACASLNHPNISTIYELGDAEEGSFIAMEFIEGRTLEDLVRERRFELSEVLKIGLQAADALAAAHRQGIIHRDLKSANVMLDTNGRVKIMDFGLAKLAHGSMLTQSGVTLGTAAYMSPEQAVSGVVDHRSDIYSLGVVLYELATGELPFKDAHPLAVMYSVVHEDPTPPRDLDAAIPEQLQAVILKAMQKDPENRYQSLDEMTADLSRVPTAEGVQSTETSQAAHGSSASVAPPASPEARVAPGRVRSKTTMKYVIFVGLLGAVTAGLILIRGSLSKQTDKTTDRALAKTHVDRALSYLSDQKRELAARELELAVENDPTYSMAWSSLAAVSIQDHNLDEAISQSRKAIELDGNNTNAFYNLAYALEEKEEYTEAIEPYSRAIDIDSTFTQAYSALGNLYLRLNSVQDAIDILDRAVRITPNSDYIFLVYKNLGRAYLAVQQYDRAIGNLKKSLELQPVVIPETVHYLAQAYEAAGQTGASVREWQAYIDIETDSLKQKEAMNHLRELTR